MAGAAAGSLLAKGWENATVDDTVKIVTPGRGEELVVRGRVVKPGYTLTVAGVEVRAAEAGREILCATALVTFRNLPPPRNERKEKESVVESITFPSKM